MYLVAIAWLYVALMMGVAEATHSQGSLLGALFTFLLYGLAPVALLMYLMRTPLRRKARRRAEAAARAAAGAAPASGHGGDASALADPDGGGHAPAAPVPGPVTPVRKEP